MCTMPILCLMKVGGDRPQVCARESSLTNEVANDPAVRVDRLEQCGVTTRMTIQQPSDLATHQRLTEDFVYRIKRSGGLDAPADFRSHFFRCHTRVEVNAPVHHSVGDFATTSADRR